MLNRIISIIAVCYLSGCHHQVEQPDIVLIKNISSIQQLSPQSGSSFIKHPKPSLFSICHDMSCHSISQITLSDSQWKQISDLFKPPAKSAEDERRQIQKAIAQLEAMSGTQAGTEQDLAGNEMRGSRFGQLNCIDEATNSNVYLYMMQQSQLLKWHTRTGTSHRGVLQGRAPHNTATIREVNTKTSYAVDSWYTSNGEPPFIVQLDEWKAGWKPN